MKKYTFFALLASTVIFFTLRSNTRAADDIQIPTSVTADGFSLQAFDAKLNAKSRVITWAMDDESQVEQYQLQRTGSPTGVFTTIYSFTPLKSNINNYTYSDDGAINTNTVYYRLAMVGKDGYARFSNVISLRTDMNVKLTLYPNPAIDQVNISFGDEVKRADIKIVSQTGRVMAGTQNFTGNTFLQDIRNYPGGVYYVQVNTANGTTSSTFIKKPI